ncbi:MAG: hypothetical protein ABJQ78_04025 [Alloalcanivorax sp.]
MNRVQAVRQILAMGLALVITACGGGGGGGGDGSSSTAAKSAGSGKIQGPITGLRYVTSSGIQGEVDAGGGYQYKQGDSVDFFVGDTLLATVTGTGYTPLSHLIPDAFSPEGTLKIQYLVSIDVDANLDNGIQLDSSVNEVATNAFLDWSNEIDVQGLLADTAGEGETLTEAEAARVDFQKMEILTFQGSRVTDIAPGSFNAIEIINYGYFEGCTAGFSDADLSVTSTDPLNVTLSLNNGDSFLIDSSAYAIGSQDPEFTKPADVLHESGQAYLISSVRLANGITGLGLRTGDYGRGKIVESNDGLVASPASMIEVSDAQGCTFRLLFNTKGAGSKGLYAFQFGLATRGPGSTELAVCGENSSSDNQLYMPIGNYTLAAFGGDVTVEGTYRNNVTGVETSETFDCSEQIPERVVKGNPFDYCLVGFDNIASCQDKRQAQEAGIPLDYAEVMVSVGGEQVFKYVEGSEAILDTGGGDYPAHIIVDGSCTEAILPTEAARQELLAMEDSFGYSYRSGECPAKSSYPYSCAVEIDKTYFYYTQDYLDLIGGEAFLPCGDGDMSSGDYGSGDGSGDVGIDEDSIVPVPSSGGEVSGYIFDSTWESNRFSFSPSESGFFCGYASAGEIDVQAWLCDDESCMGASGGWDGDPFSEQLESSKTYYMYVDTEVDLADNFDPIPVTLSIMEEPGSGCPEE